MKILKAFFFTLLASLVLGVFYFLTLLGPGKVEQVKFNDIDPLAESSRLLKESERLEMEFEQAATANTITQKAIEKLRDAIALQEKYIDRALTGSRAPAERLMKLQTRLQNVEAQPISETIDSIAIRAQEAEDRKDISTARDLFKEAYDLQSKVNAEYPLSKFNNITKRVNFDRKVKMLEAQPAYMKSVELEKSAIQAREKGDVIKAKELYEKTLEAISHLHATYPSSIYTDFSRLMQIESELQSLNSGGLAEKIVEHLKQAKEAEAKGEYLIASEAYSDAAQCQRNINKLYPKSKLVSEEKAREYELKKVEAYSWKFAQEIKEQDATLIKSLQKGDMSQVPETTANLIRKTEHFTKNFPQSKLLPDDILMRLRYIDFMVKDISKVQKLIYSSLNAIENSKSRKMLKTEVSQELYSIVMQENPSRYSDNLKRPVDSVTLDDAQRFCQRASWLLGKKVELPSLAEYKTVIGSLRYVDLNDISWNNMNSGGMTQPVATKKSNDKGFFDLLGNVAEFVKKDSSATENIKIIGGGAQTSLDAMTEIPLKDFDPKQRNRMVGFRIVVEL
ncbi:MAG: formylglycine-generating enzyme family protein [Opitutales bacterium]|nr:formylglycine-generating enzyme family protein [Opitutales bacterium]